MRVWTFQDPHQSKKYGLEKTPWSVGFYVEGRRRCKRVGSKSRAEKYARRLEGQLAAGTFQGSTRKPWGAFLAEYEARMLCNLKPRSRVEALNALANFQRIASPQSVSTIKTATVDAFLAQRRTESGKKPESTVSAYTI